MTDQPRPPASPDSPDANGRIRLQKFLASCGVASRRQSETLIVDGRIRVNGLIVTTLGTTVDPNTDQVELDGKRVRQITDLTILFHKPRNCLCSKKDPQGRPVIYEFLPPELQHLNYVGRLDFDTSGLLLLTSNGELLRRLTLPEYGVKRVYRALVDGHIVQRSLRQLEQGITVDGELLKAHRAEIKSTSSRDTLVEVTLTEGRNREVKRLFEAIGHRVLQLTRIRFADLALGDLRSASYRQLDSAEIDHLYHLANLS